MGKKSLSALVLLSVVTINIPSTTHADESLDIMQITCSENLSYLSVRTIKMEDRNFPQNEERKFNEAQGLYTVKGLLEHPYTCKIGSEPITVEIADYSPAQAAGECGGMGHYDVLIKRSGNKIYQFSPYEFCTDPKTHLVEILPPTSLRDCLIPDGPGQMTCSYPGK